MSIVIIIIIRKHKCFENYNSLNIFYMFDLRNVNRIYLFFILT